MAEGKSVQQTVELLTRKLELLGAEKQGTFCVDCETYHTAASTIGSQGRYREHRHTPAPSFPAAPALPGPWRSFPVGIHRTV